MKHCVLIGTVTVSDRLHCEKVATELLEGFILNSEFGITAGE